MFISSTPISSVLRSAPTVESQSLNILMSLSVLRFLLTFFISAVSICGCFLVCHLFLRVTMTSSTQGKITGYLSRALIWIGNVFVYHTCKKGTYYVQICDNKCYTHQGKEITLNILISLSHRNHITDVASSNPAQARFTRYNIM